MTLAENIYKTNIGENNFEAGNEGLCSDTSATVSAELSQKIGDFNTSCSVQSAKEGTTYGLNGRYNYTKKFNNISLSLNPTVGGDYTKAANDTSCQEQESSQFSDVYSANAGLNGELFYKQRDLQAGLSVNENIGTQFPCTNNNLTVTATAKYKNLGFSLSNTNINFSE